MENECCICNNKLTMETIVNTSCGHTFCKDCCFSWLRENPTCPLCRTRFIKTKEEELTEKAQELRNECREIEEYKDLIISQIEHEKEKYKEIYDNHAEMLKSTHEKMINYKNAIKDLKVVYEYEEKNLENLQINIREVKSKLDIFKKDNDRLIKTNNTLIKTNENFGKINKNLKNANDNLQKANESLKITNEALKKTNKILSNDNEIFNKEKKRKQHIREEYLKDWNRLYGIPRNPIHPRDINYQRNIKNRRNTNSFFKFNFNFT